PSFSKVGMPAITGLAEAGATVKIYTLINGIQTQIGTSLVGPDGTWAIVPASVLNDGKYNISAIQTSRAGISSIASSPQA
ncbi:Ig-like domain-containing protein, partial [Rhizosaccharibacter radicis]|nr:Ig-like domain-containing protein [Acetobacteraceae bacterium KSS12]